MKVAIYLAAVPNNKSDIKLAALRRFATGVSRSGDQVIIVEDNKLVNCDIAVMQGFVHNDLSSSHLQFRKRILDNNRNTIIIDSNLFQFANTANPNCYLRYSINGVFPTTGFYFDNNIDTTRWESIKQNLRFDLLPYRTSGKHILLCVQRINGWSMTGNNVQTWLNDTISKIKTYSNRLIVVRKHPGDKQQKSLIIPRDVKVSNSQFITEDLQKAWATVTFNSSPGVASLINGVPVFVTDPITQHSQTWPICNLNLSNLENPTLTDRTHWINKLSQCHWNDYEIESGKAWSFMRERIKLREPNLY